jgi:hypothetical protein
MLDSTVPASGFWRSHQQHEHITLKELRAVRYAVESFMPELANHIVQLYEDNQAAVAIHPHVGHHPAGARSSCGSSASSSTFAA